MEGRKKIVLYLLGGLALIAVLAGGIFLFLNKTKQSLAPKEELVSEADREWNKRIDDALASSECEELPKPVYDSSLYQGPLIDTHFHLTTIADATPGSNDDWKNEKFYTSPGVNMTFDDYACLLRNDGTSGKVFAFFPVYPNIEWQSLKLAKKAMEKYSNVFVPFINAPDGDIGSVDGPTLKRMLGYYPGLFKGFGELGLYGAAAPALPPDSERLLGTYPVVKENKLLVYFHLGEKQKDSYQKVLKANRDINFLFHGDQLISCGDGCDGTLKEIDEILSNNPNVYYGIDELYGDVVLLNEKSTKEGILTHLKNRGPLLKQDLATWKGFIERHPDQVIWGTDRGSYLYSLDVEIGRAMVEHTRAFIAGLDPAVQEKFAYKNAEKLLIK